MYMVDHQLHAVITVLADGRAQVCHRLRLRHEIHEHVLEAHQKMQTLENAGGRERPSPGYSPGRQRSRAPDTAPKGRIGWLQPARRSGTLTASRQQL